MDFSALSGFIEEDNGSEGYEDLLGFSEGGPVGESMQDEVQPAMQYFSEGGEVDDESPDEEEVEDIGEIPSRPEVPQAFSKGGVVKKAAQLLKELGVAEGKVAGKELTTLQDVHTSLGDRIREGAAKMQQQMDAMEFKYGPGQYVFTESGAKKNLSPLQIKARHLYGDQPVRETPISKASRDPVTGEVLRTPYEPGYLVRQQRPDGWAEFIIPESAIKGTVDGFAKGGPVNRAQGSPIEGERPFDLPPTFGQRMGAAVSDAVTGAAVNLYDLLAKREGMSAAHKIYLDSFARDKRDPITAKDFDAAELAELQNLILQKEAATGGKGRGTIQYKDYDTLPGGDQRRATGPSLIGGRMPPRPSLSKSLGQFGYERDPKSGQYRVIDEYDFNPQQVAFDGKKIDVPVEHYGDYLSNTLSPYELARLYAGRKMPPGTGRKVDLSVPAQEPRKRAQGSPIYGEIPDSGPITADTFASFKAKGPSASSVVTESARMLRNITGEGLSNLESRIRGSVAAIPGSVGDIESIFRESDKTRRFATTEEVLRDYMPGRLTKPTKEAKGFEELGSYLPLAIPAGTMTKTAGAVKAGARKALEELGPTAGSILERAVPKFGILPEGPSAPTNLAQRVEQGKFFKGRLDDFVSQVRNPVTKQQFLGSLKGKFREYDISRAAQALADLDDAAKLTPTDLVSRINAVATPNRYKTTFIEPKDSGLHNRFDNVYGATGQPVGVINLSYEPTRAAVEAEEASAAARSAAAGLGRGTGDPEKIQTLTSFLETSQELAKAPERKAQLIAGLNNLSDQLSTARAEIAPVAQGITDIVFGNIPEYKGYFDRLREATKGISFPRNTPEYEEAFKNIDEQLKGEIKIQALRRLYQEQPSLRTFLPLKEGETFDELVQGLGGTKYVAEELLPRMRKNLYERLDDTSKAVLVDNKALLDDVLRETQRYSTYKGSHTAVNPEKNAMGFSRFTEHRVNVPGLGNLDGIYVSELQSDMFRDIKKLGKKGGSAAKDKQEVTSLFDGIKTRLDPLRQQIEDRFGSMDSFMFVLRGDMTGKPDPAEFSDFLTTLGPISKGKADQIATDTIKDVKRITKLQERLGLPGGQVKGTYDIEEPIANIEVQPQVVQQLLAKNAIAGAMKMGKDFVAFPGVESKQAKLYEKLPRNLDAVLKDLGEGFVKQPITIKDATGTERQHWAVIWDKNAAQRVLNQGVPFKKGGLVEKSAMNNRRYI